MLRGSLEQGQPRNHLVQVTNRLHQAAWGAKRHDGTSREGSKVINHQPRYHQAETFLSFCDDRLVPESEVKHARLCNSCSCNVDGGTGVSQFGVDRSGTKCGSQVCRQVGEKRRRDAEIKSKRIWLVMEEQTRWTGRLTWEETGGVLHDAVRSCRLGGQPCSPTVNQRLQATGKDRALVSQIPRRPYSIGPVGTRPPTNVHRRGSRKEGLFYNGCSMD